MTERSNRTYDSGGSATPDTHTDDLEVATLHESGLTQSLDEAERSERDERADAAHAEANLILIAHPDGKRLGTRLRLTPGSSVEIGRSPPP